jgi:predicted esterase
VDRQEDGRIDEWIVVRGLLETDGGPLVDCRSASGACVLVAGDPDAAARTWGTMPLDFDAGAPLADEPALTLVTPPPYQDRQLLDVDGTGFEPTRELFVALCSSGVGDPWCSDERRVVVGDDGAFSVSLVAVSDIVPPGQAPSSGLTCSPPGRCAVTVLLRHRTPILVAELPVVVEPTTFTVRYLEPVFAEAAVTRREVYGRGLDATGAAVDLVVVVMEPVGDEATLRPVLVGMDHDTSLEFARRGFVTLMPEYRQGADNSREGLLLARDNVLPLFDWIRSQADSLRIDPAGVAMGGTSFGGITALNVAYLPAAADGEPSSLAAAIAIAGFGPSGFIETGEPPALLLHGDSDGRIPLDMARQTCAEARAVEVECEIVEYPGRGHELGALGADRYDIWDRIAVFLVESLEL